MVMIKCDQCGKEFNKAPANIKIYKNHFCSIKCKGIYSRNKVKIVCEYCGKECSKKSYQEKRWSIHFCSKECYNKFRVDIKNRLDLIKKRFMSYVKVVDRITWLWKGGKSSKGYGLFRYKGKNTGAHRASYMLFKGEIPKGMYVMHEDDKRDNVCPKILKLGTLQDNHKDMVSKNRHIKGKDCHSAVLTEDKVIELREMYKTGNYSQTKLSNIFGIKQCTVSQIITRKTWKHI